MKMLKHLNRPYPFSFQPQRRIKQLVPIGLFAFGFFTILKPFGWGNEPDYILKSAYYSFVGVFIGLLTTVIIPKLIPSYFDESKWTLKRNLFWSLIIYISFPTLTFLLYIPFSLWLYDSFPFAFKTYILWLIATIIFGIPFGLIINLANQYYLLKRHLKIANNINSVDIPKLESEIKNLPIEFEIDMYSKLNLDVSQIVYAEALGNYVNIIYNDEKIKKVTIRETIGNIEKKISVVSSIYKTHRSYLVNLNYVTNVSGDAQGLKIHFKNTDSIVPVSRSKVKEFKSLISAF